MVRAKFSDKLSVAFYTLLDKGPLSISSLAEEVSKAVGGKVTTARAQLSVALPDLIRHGLVEEVGTDRFGSRLIDITPKAVDILLLLFSSGFEYRYLPWEPLARYFDRRLPHLAKYVRLLKCLVDVWRQKVFGTIKEDKESFSDFIEDLSMALMAFKDVRVTEEDIKRDLFKYIVNVADWCLRVGCEDLMLEEVKKLKLEEELKEVVQHAKEGVEKLSTILKRL